MAVEYVQAQKEDLPFIVAVYNQNIASKKVTADLKPVTIAEREAWVAAHNDRRPLWIIENDGEKVGWLSLNVIKLSEKVQKLCVIWTFCLPSLTLLSHDMFFLF